MKKKQVLWGLVALGIFLGIWASQSIKLKATESQSEPETFANTPVEWVGDSNQAGKLKYGYTKANSGNSPLIEKSVVPNVLFDKGEGEMISHIFTSRSNGQITGSGFNLYENSEEYQTATTGGPQPGRPVGIIEFETPSLAGNTIKAKGKRQGSLGYLIESELVPIEKNAQILHSFTITNTEEGVKTFYPIRYVDTELANNDNVKVRSRGPGKGLYIETVEYDGETPVEDSPLYRLDYITNIPNGPIAYKGVNHSSSPARAFGEDMKKPDKSHMNVAEGEIVPGPTITDSAIILAWGEQVLAGGESVTLSYAVGMTAGNLEVRKDVKNNTSQDDKYRVNDELEYNVSLINQDLYVYYNDLVIADQLPTGLAAPSKIVLVQADGSEEELNLKEVYDEKSHKITVKPVKVAAGKEDSPAVVKLKYITKITEAGADSDVTNKVLVTGHASSGAEIEEEADETINVLPMGKVIVNYQDSDKNELIPQKIILGSVGDAYNESPTVIAGYTNQSVEGKPQGEITKEDQVITFIYQQKSLYNLVQMVTNSGGINLDGGEAAVNEVLTYSIALIPEIAELTEEEQKASYHDVLITEVLDPALEEAKELSLKTKAGVKIGEAKYDSEKREITGSLKASEKIKMTEELILSYQGKVKADTGIGTIVKEQATSVVSYSFSESYSLKKISNEVKTEISKASAVRVKYVNEDGDEVHEPKSYELGEDGSYDEQEILIDGFSFDHAEGETSGTVAPGESVLIIFHYKSVQFELEQEVSLLDGSSAELVKNEAELLYTVKLKSKLTDEALLYNEFKLVVAIDSSLENVKEVKLVNPKGNKVGTANFADGKVTATLAKADNIKGLEDLTLTYQATVKDKLAAPEGTKIKAQAKASGSYYGSMVIPAREQLSNEVVSSLLGGDLIFQSAPETLSFGEDLKLSLKAKDYPVVSKNSDLVVLDTRGKKEVWSMTAKMTKLMINGQHNLKESMHYVLNGKAQLMDLETSANVYDGMTESDEAVIISDQWKDVTAGPVLKVGKNEAQIGNYQGVIQWTLQDVPLGEE